MKSLKSVCIELLKENHGRTIKTDSDAELVFEIIAKEVRLDKLKDFIEDDLCIFSSQYDAYDWFSNGEENLLVALKNTDITITNNMVGQNLRDVLVSELLSDKENYIKVNDNIHLTYWM